MVATRLVSLASRACPRGAAAQPGTLQLHHSLPSPPSSSSRPFLTHFPSLHCTMERKQNGAEGEWMLAGPGGRGDSQHSPLASLRGTGQGTGQGTEVLEAAQAPRCTWAGKDGKDGFLSLTALQGHILSQRALAVTKVTTTLPGRCGTDPERREGTGIWILTNSRPPPHPCAHPHPAPPASSSSLAGGQRLLPGHREG